MMNDFSNDFAYLATDETTYNVQYAPEYFITYLDLDLDYGRHGFTLYRYKDELGCAREISFSSRYYLGSFVENLRRLSVNGMFL